MVRALEGGNADYEALFWLAAGVIARLTNDSVMLDVLRKKAAGAGELSAGEHNAKGAAS